MDWVEATTWLLSSEQELAFLEQFAQRHFREFEFRGFLGKRRVVSFGWRYDFNTRELQKAEAIPDPAFGGLPVHFSNKSKQLVLMSGPRPQPAVPEQMQNF